MANDLRINLHAGDIDQRFGADTFHGVFFAGAADGGIAGADFDPFAVVP